RLEQRPRSNLQHRLRRIASKVRQSTAQATCHDHDPVRTIGCNKIIVDKLKSDYNTGGIDYRYLVQAQALHRREDRIATFIHASTCWASMHGGHHLVVQSETLQQAPSNVPITQRTKQTAR